MKVLKTYKEVSGYLKKYRTLSGCLIDGIEFSGRSSEILLYNSNIFANTTFRNCLFKAESPANIKFSCSGKVIFHGCSFVHYGLSIESITSRSSGKNVLKFIDSKSNSFVDTYTGFDSIVLERSSLKYFQVETSVASHLMVLSSDVKEITIGDPQNTGYFQVTLDRSSPLIINNSNIDKILFESNVKIMHITKESPLFKSIFGKGIKTCILDCRIFNSDLEGVSFEGIYFGYDFRIIDSNVKNTDLSKIKFVHGSCYYGKKHITLVDCEGIELIKIPKGFELKEGPVRINSYLIVEKD